MADHVISPPEAALAAPLEHSRRQLEALLEVSEAIAQQRDLPALFHDLAQRLHSVVDFDFLALTLHDPVRDVVRLHVLETRVPTETLAGREAPAEGHPAGWVLKTQQPFVVGDIDQESRFPDFLQRMHEHGVRSFALLPLTTAQRRLGAMGFGRLTPQRITDSELQFMQRVAAQVAVAVDNALNHESSQAYQQQLARECHRRQVLLEVNGLLKIHALDFPGRQDLIKEETVVSLNASPSGRCFSNGQPLILRGGEIERFDTEIIRVLRSEGVQTICCTPLVSHGRTFGTLNLASRRSDAFPPSDLGLLQQVAAQIAIAVENALAFKEIEALKNKLAVEKLYLEEEIRSEFNFEEIVGDSPALKRALAQVELVAPAATTVLILGETGTGKELIARAIHNLSPRRERTFVKINCAAIPTGLLESELFGHERGAFTGALAQKIGRFELADRGTIFLDEVGDIPLGLQPKLLRVLQEHEFERLGSNRPQRVDVRIVAATNGDLSKLVAERAFRSDLYYRLNVFPIHIPPLRERREDVPLLVRYFVQKFSRRLNKTVEYVPADAMDVLANYSWPGNIRELENLVERAVLLSPGKELRAPLGELKAATLAAAGAELFSPAPTPSATSASFLPTLAEADRQHILRALRQTEWRIAGPKGAAALLGMKRTTLQARMRKLGIRRPV